MSDQDKKFKDQWDKTLAKGRIIYGLTHGSVFGFAIFILVNMFELKDESVQNVFFTRQAFEQIGTMILAGIIGYSTVKWWINQKVYNKILNKEKSES